MKHLTSETQQPVHLLTGRTCVNKLETFCGGLHRLHNTDDPYLTDKYSETTCVKCQEKVAQDLKEIERDLAQSNRCLAHYTQLLKT